MKAIPVVDLKNIVEVSKASEDPDWLAAAEAIRNGLGEIGFLYLLNHGISDKVISNMFKQSQSFFGLPPEIKEKYRKDTSSKDKGVFDLKAHCGFMPVGGEILDKNITFELKETYDWVNPAWSFCPSKEVPHFEESLIQLDKECKILYKKILKLLALALKLDDENFFLNTCRYFDEPEKHTGLWVLRVIHYPRIDNVHDAKPGVVRCGKHSDFGFLTMLFQDDVGGLEVQTLSGGWVEAKPIPGTILLNTGDLTEFWTSGVLPATIHRIRIPNVDETKRMQDRYSIAAFLGPDSSTIITPMDLEKRPIEMERLKSTGKVYKKEPISAHDHFMGQIANMYGG